MRHFAGHQVAAVGEVGREAGCATYGERRPADMIGAAIMVARIASGEIEGAKGKFYLDCFDR
jgi:hypothetical protein